MLGKPNIPRTLILDIDGTLLKHRGRLSLMLKKANAIKGVAAKLDEAVSDGHYILLITGRPESARAVTVKQLSDCGLVYHQLVMGVGHGARILINDLSPHSPGETAVGISVKRDRGISDLNIADGTLEERS